jgi:Flp pilus assembly protein TadD
LDFLPALMLLVVIGIFGLERVLVSSPSWRRIVRLGWCLLLVYSIVISLLVSVQAHASANFLEGNFLVNQGRPKEAIKFFQKALTLESGSAGFHFGLASAYYQTKQPDEAILQCQKSLAIDPDNADAHNNLGKSLRQTGQVNEMITHFQRAVEIKPDFAAAHNNLGCVLFQTGRINEAITHFQRAVEIEPDYAEAHNNLGLSLFRAGRVNEAIAHFQRALEIRPDLAETYNPEVNNNLAWFLATDPDASKRNGALAVKLAEDACRKTHYQEPVIVGTLAAAYAKAGRFDEAIAAAQKAYALASPSGDQKLLERIQEHLASYRNHQPYRESPVPVPSNTTDIQRF